MCVLIKLLFGKTFFYVCSIRNTAKRGFTVFCINGEWHGDFRSAPTSLTKIRIALLHVLRPSVITQMLYAVPQSQRGKYLDHRVIPNTFAYATYLCDHFLLSMTRFFLYND